MPRPPLPEHLMIAATMGVLVMRPARLRARERYFVDGTDPALITVYLAHDLAPHERRPTFDRVDRAVRDLLRRRRRAGLEPVTEVEGDVPDLDETDTEGDVRPALSVVR